MVMVGGNSANIRVRLNDIDDRKRSQQEIAASLSPLVTAADRCQDHSITAADIRVPQGRSPCTVCDTGQKP